MGQIGGLLVAAAILVVAFLFNSPFGEHLYSASRPQLLFLMLACNVGSVLAAVGLVLGGRQLAWAGAGVVLGVVFLHGPLGWFLVPFAVALLACVLLWEAARPPSPKALPPQWPAPPAYGYGYQPPYGPPMPYVAQGWAQAAPPSPGMAWQRVPDA